MDVRNVIFPMTADDLVVSTRILCQTIYGSTVHTLLAEVLTVTESEDGQYLIINLSDVTTLSSFEIKLKPGTPVLITGISRT